MLTDTYKKKISKSLKIYKFFYKFRVLFIVLITLIVGVSSAMLSIKGMVIDEIKISNVSYGEKLTYSSKGLFDNYIHYEFKEINSEEWTLNEPKNVGKYQIRGVSKNIFGGYYYGSPQDFEITPKIVKVENNNETVIYGDLPPLNFNLNSGDELINAEYVVNSVLGTSANISLKEDTVKVIDSDNYDVTYCYSFEFDPTYDVTFKRKDIRFDSSGEFVYDGKPHKVEEITPITDLYSNDTYVVESAASFESAGFHNNRPNISFYNEKGVDVTSLYKTYFEGFLYIEPLPLEVSVGDYTKTYDMKVDEANLDCTIEKGNLLEGHRLVARLPSRVDAGEYDCDIVRIFDENGENVTSNYNLTINPGKYTIKPKRVTVTFKFANKIYDGKQHNNLISLDRGGVFDGHSIGISPLSFDAVHAGTHNENFKVVIADQSGENITKNYVIDISCNNYVVSQREITIQSEPQVFVYDGNDKEWPYFSIVGGVLADGDSVIVSSWTKESYPGIYDNELTFEFRNMSYGDVTTDYIVNFVPSKIEIKLDGGSGGDFEGGNPLIGDNAPLEYEEIDKEEINNVLLEYTPSESGSAFFKSNTYGDYNGKAWLSAPSYQSIEGINVQELTSIALRESNFNNRLKGTLTYKGVLRVCDLVPIYPNLKNPQETDIYSIESDLVSENIEVDGYEFDYVKDHQYLDGFTHTTYRVINEEKNYYQFVKNNYSDVPSNMKSSLDEIINEYNLKGNTLLDTINNLVLYFKNNFTYSMFDIEASNSSNPILTFLTETHDGKCDYFAGAGTLLLREMGYYARMAGGFMVNGSDVGRTYEISSTSAHAISEVYLENVGWIKAEFTVAPLSEKMEKEEIIIDGASQSGSCSSETSLENSKDDKPSSASGKEEEKFDLYFYTDNGNFTYDGSDFSKPSYQMVGELKEGHKVVSEGWSTISKYGNVLNNASFNIVDENNNIVTDQYTISKNLGTLTVNKRVWNFETPSLTLTLDELKNNPRELYLEDNLAMGDKLEGYLDLAMSITKPGTYTYVVIVTKITNEKNEDVTSSYNIVYKYGTLTVNP